MRIRKGDLLLTTWRLDHTLWVVLEVDEQFILVQEYGGRARKKVRDHNWLIDGIICKSSEKAKALLKYADNNS